MLVDGRGVPLSLVVTGANRHDVSQLKAVLDAIVIERPSPPVRRHKHLCADAGYTGAPALKVIEEHGYIPHVNSHETKAAPLIMKENCSAARGCLMSCKSFGALTPHVNLIPATNSYPKLLPLSTNSKQSHAPSVGHRQFGRLTAPTRAAHWLIDTSDSYFPQVMSRGRGSVAHSSVLSQ